MIPSYLMFIPGVSAVLNRYWRGEGAVKRWVWYAFMTSLGFLATFDLKFTAIWLLFLVGYAMLPWHAMFSAVHGQGPSRRDPRYAQWMQTVAFYLIGLEPMGKKTYTTAVWRNFGKVYGAIRALPMLPAVFAFALYLKSPVPLIGIAFFGMGLVYFYGGKAARHVKQPGIAIALSEIIMGWCVATYMLICAGTLY